jgi:hypothetical protein
VELQIYELADIAAILGLEKARVKNWTIGRPFSVRPSIRPSFGKGTRNLFSKSDVYCFALVKRLNEIGTPVSAIQQMLKDYGAELAEDSRWWGGGAWLVIERLGSSDRIGIQVTYKDAAHGHAYMMLRPEDEVACFYAVNLKLLADAISTRIDVFSDQHEKLTPKKSKKKKHPDAKQR